MPMNSNNATNPIKAGTSKAAAEARRQVFIEAYLANGGNATDAAKKAGYSEKTAGSQGQRLLKDVGLKAAIAARANAVAKKYELTTDLVIRSITQELRFDPASLFLDDGTLRPMQDLDEDTRSALVSVETMQFGSPEAPVFVRKYKWAAKSTAREQAMKHLGMFERDNAQARPVTKVVMVPTKIWNDDDRD